VKKVAPKKAVKVVKKVAPKKVTPKKVVKKVVPKTIVKTIVKKIVEKPKEAHGVSELLVKAAEKNTKITAKSSEEVNKNAAKGREEVAKEMITKSHQSHKEAPGKLDLTKAAELKGKLGAEEMKGKGEVHTKSAVEKVKKESKVKLAKQKKVAPVEVHHVNVQSALERLVKNCKTKEERFHKSKATNKATMKELKTKVAEKPKMKCTQTHEICQEINEASQSFASKYADIIADHDRALHSEMRKTESYEAGEAEKMKFNICKSAASNMEYFAKKFLYGKI